MGVAAIKPQALLDLIRADTTASSTSKDIATNDAHE
jgi:hypothetical protein